jgi:hypothetical protein
MKLKNNLFALAGIGTAGLKIVQGFAMDLSKMLAGGSRASMAFYGASEHAKIGAGVSLGVFAAEGIGKLESILRVPKLVRGAIPFAAATLGVGAIAYYYQHAFGIPETQGVMDSTRQVLSGYLDSVYQVFTFNPKANPNKLAGAAAFVYSAAKFAKNFIGALVGYANRKENERGVREQIEEAEQAAST